MIFKWWPWRMHQMMKNLKSHSKNHRSLLTKLFEWKLKDELIFLLWHFKPWSKFVSPIIKGLSARTVPKAIMWLDRCTKTTHSERIQVLTIYSSWAMPQGQVLDSSKVMFKTRVRLTCRRSSSVWWSEGQVSRVIVGLEEWVGPNLAKSSQCLLFTKVCLSTLRIKLMVVWLWRRSGD